MRYLKINSYTKIKSIVKFTINVKDKNIKA